MGFDKSKFGFNNKGRVKIEREVERCIFKDGRTPVVSLKKRNYKSKQ